MPLELHERGRIGVAQMARVLGETRQAMGRWLLTAEVPVHQRRKRARRWVYSDDLRIYAPDVFRALQERSALGAAGGIS